MLFELEPFVEENWNMRTDRSEAGYSDRRRPMRPIRLRVLRFLKAGGGDGDN